ncbi:MAG: peptide-binding protein, partial [Leptospirales bacterium]|nr:peptide-binding protein [Leptospirales bacterium]
KSVNMQVNSFAVSTNNTIAAATSKGLYVGKGDTKKSWDRVKSRTANMGNNAYTVAISPTNDIFVGTDKGLAKSSVSNLDQWVSIGGKIEINSIIIDQNGRVLVATNNGLNISLDQGEFWVTYKEENGLASNRVYRSAVNPVSGIIWTLSIDSGLSYSD